MLQIFEPTPPQGGVAYKVKKRLIYSLALLTLRVESGDREVYCCFSLSWKVGAFPQCFVGVLTFLYRSSGSFAYVHLAFDTLACKQVACKTVITRSRDDVAMKKVMKEVEILGNLDHVSGHVQSSSRKFSKKFSLMSTECSM